MFEGIEHVHFVGIGGIGMSGIAKNLLDQGIHVSGSDARDSQLLEGLRKLGAAIHVGQREGNIPPETDLVLVTEAISSDNPELYAAKRRNLRIRKYAQALGALMNKTTGVAVAGTHGKTSTSAMLAVAAVNAGLDPSFVIGGEVRAIGGSSRVGKGDLFIAEACEYRRSFLNLHPRVAILNNIEEDHLDYYDGLDEILQAFSQFASQVPSEGTIVANGEDPNVLTAIGSARSQVVTFGLSPGMDYHAKNIRRNERGLEFTLVRKGREEGGFSFPVPGRHCLLNSLAVIAAADALGIPREYTRDSLEQFPGVHRRLERVGIRDNVIIIDDYAHHPTAIATTLEAIRYLYPGRRVWCVFQPHQHSRTRFLLKDFAQSLVDADVTLIPDIYFVRDSLEEKNNISSEDLVHQIRARGGHAVYLPSLDQILAHLEEHLDTGEVLITMGAGDIGHVAVSYLSRDRRFVQTQ